MAGSLSRGGRHTGSALRRWSPTEKQVLASRILHDPKVPNVLFDGGARSGKTESIIRFFVTRAMQYPCSDQLMLRKVRRSAQFSLWESMVKHLRRFVPRDQYRIYNDDMIVVFANDSRIMVDGLDDNVRLENILGTEYITIFVNEATQIGYAYINLLKSRLAQRAFHATRKDFVAPTKMIADCNPRHKRHWLYRLGVKNVRPDVVDSDVPLEGDARWVHLHWTPYDNKKNLPPNYIETHLDTLPDKIRQRMKLGEWVNIEGCVYDNFDDDAHVLSGFTLTPEYHVVRAIDFGYTNPFCCLWLAVKHDYSHIVVFDEHYYAKRTVNWHAPKIIERSMRYPSPVATYADWEAEQRANLEEQGIPVEEADKSLLSGIDRVYRALEYGPARRPVLQVTQNCINTIAEFYSYRWPDEDVGTKQRIKGSRDEPVDTDNHAMACIRYAVNAMSDELELRSVLSTLAEDMASPVIVPKIQDGYVIPTVSWDESYGKEGFGSEFFDR